MVKIVLVGYDKMLYSLIEGIEKLDKTKFKIVGVLRNDRRKYTNFELFFKDIFNPSKDYTNIKYKKLYDIKASSVNSKEFISEIEKLEANLVIVGSWGEKFKKSILDKITCVNFHPALLPKNRGANPYFWTIYLNQNVTGLTIHYMNEKFDRGDILFQEAITISDNETGETLKDKTTLLAKTMVQEFLILYEQKQLQPIKQDEKYASYEHQLTIKEMIIDLNKNKVEVDRHLRALYPWAIPYIEIKKRFIQFYDYEFLTLDEKYKNEKNAKVVENNEDYFLLKGNDFLFKIYK